MQRTEAPLRQLTFLFADVEGSTRIAERHGATAGAALARYHELVGTVAARATAAASSSASATARMPPSRTPPRRSPPPPSCSSRSPTRTGASIGRLRIRIALVSGEVEIRGDRYYGRPLFRAARLQALANGGETLLAGSTADGLGAPPGRDRSCATSARQRLRDVAEPERVFALVHTSRARSSERLQADATDMQGTDTVTDEDGPIRVLLVDDHAVVRRGLRGFLELIKDFDVVGEAENGREGVAAADRLAPDVILMDLLMPEMGGLEAIGPSSRRTRRSRSWPSPRSSRRRRSPRRSRPARPATCSRTPRPRRSRRPSVPPTTARSTWIPPSRGCWPSASASARTPSRSSRSRRARRRSSRSWPSGAANKEIAYELGITERTARTHVSNILGKLGLASRTQAALYAVEHKLV